MSASLVRTTDPWRVFPLYHHVIRMLNSVPEIDLVVVDTDSEFIIEDCSQNFPQVLVLLRPEHLRDGAIAMNDVLLNTLDQVDADVVLQTHSTNPFLRLTPFLLRCSPFF